MLMIKVGREIEIIINKKITVKVAVNRPITWNNEPRFFILFI